jgi:ribose transport system ATP-binding protein
MSDNGAPRPEPRLRLENVSKTFSSTTVLKEVDLQVGAGEVHGLVGQNGSGKSTLIKILAGYYQPDPGARAWVDGNPFDLGLVNEAHVRGLRFVHQDLALVLELNAVDNVALGGGYARRRMGVISWSESRALTKRALGRFGVSLDIDIPLSKIAPVERTAVAIVRALAGWEDRSGVLVLDEPTAALPAWEVERLHQIVREVSQHGAGVIYVSHRLDDVVAVADHVSVLREGDCVGTYEVGKIDSGQLATLMVGRRVHRGRRPDAFAGADVVLRARDVAGRWLAGANLDVRRGEIVGIAGVLGSGREELPYALASSASAEVSGEISVNGEPLRHGSPNDAQRLGIGFVPADRNREAVVSPFVLRENLTLAALPQIAPGGIVRAETERALVVQWMDKVQVVPRDPERLIPLFSGGNQQKVMLARVLSRSPAVLVLSEPTAGVDIGAREALYELIREEVKQRALTVVIASSDAQDLVALCHRVIVMQDGAAALELSGSEITEQAILHAMEGTTDTQTDSDGQE